MSQLQVIDIMTYNSYSLQLTVLGNGFFLGGLLRKKSLEEIFNKNMAYGQKYIIGI